jgi:hypothetical protein
MSVQVPEHSPPAFEVLEEWSADQHTLRRSQLSVSSPATHSPTIPKTTSRGGHANTNEPIVI